MRLSIGHRLFLSVLLAILGVVATAIVLMRQNVTHSVGEYALNIELDRLDELSRALATRYASAGWTFLPTGTESRHRWIARDMRRLDSIRNGTADTAPAAPPAPPAQPAPPAPVRNATTPAPPSLPVLPTLPAPPGAPGALDARVTLLDAHGSYLAGRTPGAEPSARRPIRQGGAVIGYLMVSQPPSPEDALASAFLARLSSSLWVIGVASVVLSAIAAILLAANFRQPIGRLAQGARALADGRYDVRLEEGRRDELGDLAASFNALAARLDAVDSERRKWVADTSHELRTPLSVLRAQLEALQDGVRQADAGTIAAMLRQVLSLNALIDDLYALARHDIGAPDYQFTPVDVLALAVDQAEAFAPRFAAAGLRLEMASLPRGIVRADGEALRQVLGNLLENCSRYTNVGGVVQLHASTDGATVRLIVDDSAPGLAAADLARLGQRFFRADASRSRASGGAGLGLALSQQIIKQHGGTLQFAASPLGGLRAVLTLPQVPA